jgi:hypothetical protein
MKKIIIKKIRGAKNEKPLELERDWQDVQFQYDKMNVDWNQLATQVDVLEGSDSFLPR